MALRIAFSKELAVFRAALVVASATCEALSAAWPYRSCAASDTSPATPAACFLASPKARLKSELGLRDSGIGLLRSKENCRETTRKRQRKFIVRNDCSIAVLFVDGFFSVTEREG